MATCNLILQHIGEFGSFQRRVYALLNILTIMQCCQVFLLVFVADKPEWQCSEQESALVEENRKGYPCYKNGSTCQVVSFSGEFTSIATEWKLICDQEYRTNGAQAVILAGSLAGAIVFGGVADKHGRKFAIVVMQPFSAAFSFASGLAQTYNQFVILRFFCSAFLTAVGMTVFVLISEILGPSYRDFLLTAHQGFYSCGYVVLALLAYFIRDWRTLTLVISAPAVICALFFVHTLCESPQWLLEKGRFDEGKQVLKDMAKENGSTIPEEYLEELSKNIPKENPEVSQSIFTIKGYLKKITILSSTWFLFCLLYNGLSYSSKSTSTNKYISFSLSGLVEIPSLFISILLIKSGRKMPIVYLTLTSGLACFICAWLLGGEQSQFGFFITLSAMVAKFGIAAGYSILYIFSADLFPATLRSSSMGICSTTASAGSVLAPLILYIELYDKRLPMLLFGVGAICSAMLVFTVPDTLKDDEMLGEKKIE